MSLLSEGGQVNELLTSLWQIAQTAQHENATIDLWSYYLNKRVFRDDKWDVAPEQPPVGETRRRVDLVVKFQDQKRVIRVLCFIEAKSQKAGLADCREAEEQAIDACKQYVQAYDQDNLYVLTIIGTRAKPWTYERGDVKLLPMDPEDEFHEDKRRGYIEMHSANGPKLTAAFERMKMFPPASVASTGHLAVNPIFPPVHPYLLGPKTLHTQVPPLAQQNPELTFASQFKRPSTWKPGEWKETASKPGGGKTRWFNIDGKWSEIPTTGMKQAKRESKDALASPEHLIYTFI